MKPRILSVSRREDIPAFRGDWFMRHVKNGFVNLVSSYGSQYKIEFANVKFVVFWSKNPEPFMKHLDVMPFMYYFQFSLNNYPEFELNLPSYSERINTFINLSEKIGKRKVIWRADPLILNSQMDMNTLLERVYKTGSLLHKHTERLVFSFVDPYKKLGNRFPELKIEDKIYLAKKIVEMNKDWNLSIETCSEDIEFDGIRHGKCIDADLIKNLLGYAPWLNHGKDKNQRKTCGCIVSTDVGTYRTCKHKCSYCYAK